MLTLTTPIHCMPTFLFKKLKQYLLFLGFSLPVITFISIVVESHSNEKLREISSKLETPIQIKKEEKYQPVTVRIDNFPIESGHLSSRFGLRKDPFSGLKRMHHGIDIAAKKGSFINPLGKGKVVFSGYKSGYGNVVEILHGRTVITRYAHLNESLVQENQHVNKNDIIALVGNSGRSTGPHLHLEITINGKHIDPQIFLVGNLASR